MPNHGEQPKIESLIKNRPYPENNPVTFLSCTNEDDQVFSTPDLTRVILFKG